MLTPEHIQNLKKSIRVYGDGKIIHKDINYLEGMKELHRHCLQELEFGGARDTVIDISSSLLFYEAFVDKVIDRGMVFINTLPKKKRPSTWNMIKEYLVKPFIKTWKRRMA